MSHVVRQAHAPFLIADGQLEVHQIPSAEDNLIWLLVCVQSQEAAAVDGPFAKEVLDYCQVKGFKLTTIMNTHTHGDHVGINRALHKLGMLANLRVYGAAARADEIPGITHPVGEGDGVEIGQVKGTVWLTEGHINGHISFVFDGAIFCGDTMFAAGCGYLFDGPPEKMHASLHRIASLPAETRVCCAHEYTQDNLRFAYSVEPDNQALVARIQSVWAIRAEGGCAVPSTVGEELATNPFLRQSSKTLRERVIQAWPGRHIADESGLYAATRALKDRKDYRAITDTDLPL